MRTRWIIFLFTILFGLAGCNSAIPTQVATAVQRVPSPTAPLPSVVPTPTVLPPTATAQPTRAPGCNDAAPDPITLMDVPGNPFAVIPTMDGCWIFVTLSSPGPGIKSNLVVVKRLGGKISTARTVPIDGNASGAVLTHDGKLLVIADDESVVFLDVERLVAGSDNPILGYWKDNTRMAGRVYVNVTADDQFLFVSDENVQTITVLNIAKVRSAGFSSISSIGKIPVGDLPIALTFSQDEKYLYTTSEVMSKLGWPIECKPRNSTDPNARPDRAQGAILVIDVARAKQEPGASVIATIPAGCDPVRLVTSPKGDIAYVSARGSNSLLAFDTNKLITDPARAQIGKVSVGTAPVGIAVIEEGKKIVVTNSNRFGGGADDKQSLTVIDAAKISTGTDAVLGSIPAGAFPREMRVTSDGRTLLLTNFNSRTVQIIDLNRLPIQR